MKLNFVMAVVGGVLLCAAVRVEADTTLTVDPGAPWVGFMNVFDLPADGGAYEFGSPWGVPDLVALFDNPSSTLSLYAAPIGTSDSYWYVEGAGFPGAHGNKSMDANLYVEATDTLGGQTVTFKGNVLSNSLVSPYTSVAFIKDFLPDYSSSVSTTVALTPGPFSISLLTSADPGHHVQYGFETIGPNVFPTDIASKGLVVISTAVPEPASVLLAGIAALGGVGAVRWQRRKR
jgi:PEP-CTERM motif